jgi:hypothetical protein
MTAIGNLSITEWGLFDAVSGGTMLFREVPSAAIVLVDGQTVDFTINIQQLRSA